MARCAPPTHPASAAPPAPARRILVVEDHHDSADALARLLALDGHVVEIAPTFADAHRRCSGAVFDVILCDLGLPDGNGLDLAPIARAACPRAKLIAVTGDGMPQDVRAVKAAGFDAHVLKPFQFDQVLQLVK